MFEILPCSFFFILGLIVGSFLNCVIYRLETKESFLKERSYCPRCKHVLSWKDLVPIFSFLLLKGKCRYCQKPISLQYPLVEFFTGILFVFTFYQFLSANPSNFLILLCQLSVVSCLIVVFVFDLKHYLIPDQIIYPAIFFSLFCQPFKIWNLVLGILPSLFFLMIILISKETWMGWGDFKLAILMGIFLGWPRILISLFFAFFSGALIGLVLIALKKKKLQSQIPFGPFLVAGTFFAFFFGQEMLSFYFQ
jgi:prepilin signal peptidase PulO-like enzyme (type II secretory pathway)